jgi:hypothetical protein
MSLIYCFQVILAEGEPQQRKHKSFSDDIQHNTMTFNWGEMQVNIMMIFTGTRVTHVYDLTSSPVGCPATLFLF